MLFLRFVLFNIICYDVVCYVCCESFDSYLLLFVELQSTNQTNTIHDISSHKKNQPNSITLLFIPWSSINNDDLSLIVSNEYTK
jgi:hypothetical protein